MKSKFAAFVLLLATVFVLASCLSTDDNNYTYTDDTGLTSFSVTSAKQYLHVKSSTGGDSVAVKDLTLSSYKFYIDQVNCEIYNPDSLPCGVDASKLLCSVSAYNSGVVLIKSTRSDSLAYINTSDSIDFSTERQILVYSNSGEAMRKYTIKVNVHKEMPDSFVWHAAPACDDLRQLASIRTLTLGTSALLFGTDGTATYVYANNGNGWTLCTPDFNHALGSDAWRGVVAKDGRAYISLGGDIMSTANGTNWTANATATGITRLVAASSYRLYGYAADGRIMASADNGATWTVADIDDELSLLPTGETAYVSMPVATNNNTERVLLIGSRDGHQSDAHLMVWGKIDEKNAGNSAQPWSYYDISADNLHAVPMLTAISAVSYDDAVYMLGSKDGAQPAIYCSRDNGITWNADTTFALPADFALNAADSKAYSLAAGSDNVLWLVNAANGKTWRGRINRLGWAKEQTDYTK